jgi:starch phosphorylase
MEGNDACSWGTLSVGNKSPDFMTDDRQVAYFSMEIAVDPAIPTYAGGLGILAGDTLRSCADLSVPILAVTLLHRKGYLTQTFDPTGWQRELQAEWKVEERLTELPQRTSVHIESRTVSLRAWQYELVGISGAKVPVLFLDTDLPENSDWDRTLTHFLYGGDAYYRICQEVILGIGGVRMIRALGYRNVQRFHMNEGHASLLTLELLNEGARRDGRQSITGADIDDVKSRCIFTTHTPVAAGHDQFAMDLVGRVFKGGRGFLDTHDIFCDDLVRRVVKMEPANGDLSTLFTRQNTLNLTHLALNLSHY